MPTRSELTEIPADYAYVIENLHAHLHLMGRAMDNMDRNGLLKAASGIHHIAKKVCGQEPPVWPEAPKSIRRRMPGPLLPPPAEPHRKPKRKALPAPLVAATEVKLGPEIAARLAGIEQMLTKLQPAELSPEVIAQAVREKIAADHRQWRAENRERRNAYMRDYMRARRAGEKAAKRKRPAKGGAS